MKSRGIRLSYSTPGRVDTRTAGPRGVTLIEMLVSIAVIVLLLALLLPAFGKVRSTSRMTASGANTRTLAQVIITYADTNRDLLPAMQDGVLYPAFSREMNVGVPSWYIYNMWPGVVFDLLPYNEHIAVYVSPGSPRLRDGSTPWPTSCHYSTSFVADPALWVPGAFADPRLIGARRYSDTAFPARKALLWDDEAGFLSSPRRNDNRDVTDSTPVAAADLSVLPRKPAQASDPIANPFPGPVRSRRLHNTSNGQRGVDF